MGCFCLDSNQEVKKIRSKIKNFFENILLVQKKAVPLHPLSEKPGA